MLKKTMLFFIFVSLIWRSGSLLYLMISIDNALPNAVLGCIGLICGVYGTLVFLFFIKGIKRRDMEFALILNCAVVIFDMFYLRYATYATLSTFEYVAAGSLFEVVMGIALVIMSRQRTKRLTNKKQQARQAVYN